MIFLRRCMLLRRMLAKRPHLGKLAKDIFDTYQGIKYVGTDSSEAAIGRLIPGPPVGHLSRAHWKPSVVPAGPVGLLLYSAHCHACAFDRSFVLHTLLETPVSILSDPIQFIRPLVRNFINKSRSLHASSARRALATTSHPALLCGPCLHPPA